MTKPQFPNLQKTVATRSASSTSATVRTSTSFELASSHVRVRVVESESLKVRKVEFDFLLDFLAKMPKCHKMP